MMTRKTKILTVVLLLLGIGTRAQQADSGRVQPVRPTQTISQTINGILLKIDYVPPYTDKNYYEDGYVVQIRTYRNNHLLQVLKEGGIVSNARPIVNPVDINFDGYPDLEIYAVNGGAGPNYSNFYYLFEPNKEHFVFNARLSNLSQPVIVTSQKAIYAYSRAGAATYQGYKYHWIKSRLMLAASIIVRYKGDGTVEQRMMKRVNGKTEWTTRVVPEDQAFPKSWIRPKTPAYRPG